MKKLTDFSFLNDFTEDLNNNKAFGGDLFLDWESDKNVCKSSIEKLEKFLSDDETPCTPRKHIILHSADEASNLSRTDSDNTYELIREKRKYKILKSKRKYKFGKKAKKKNIVRTKPKREPLPMKLRALPKSFWEQPNIPNILSPGAVYPVMPIFPPLATNSREIVIVNDEIREEGVVSDANTDLLFSLFRHVEAKQRKLEGDQTVPITKRGRPKKHSIALPKPILRDEDPCLVSTVTAESILPLIPVEKGAMNSLEAQIAEGEQVLAMGLLNQKLNVKQLLSTNSERESYLEILTDLVFQL